MDLKKLFIEELNYEPVFKKLSTPEIEDKENIIDLEIAFEKNNLYIILVRLKNLNSIFEKTMIKILKKQYPDALYLFTSGDDSLINIYNIKFAKDKKERLRKLTYDEINNKTRLFKEKVRFFEVSEDITGKLSLKEKIDSAFDAEKVTKRFYVEFKKYHDNFLKFIKGIPVEKDAEWYASVILNRLMFIYFIQKKGFINNDYDYLKHKFNEIEKQGKNFYSDFLTDLFFIGFATKDKPEEFKKKYGNIPYLNGGLFLPHQIESKYKNISIENKAFKEIISYFDRYVWYLDERPLRNENEINPDILGYIFEKYINQKELGAYYTKEDITGYICRNTIIPYIFDRLRLKNYEWFLKKINIEEYVYEGITDRKKRVEEIKKAHQNGEIKDINDFITYNLNIEKFAIDFIDNLKDEETLKHLYFDILKNIKILDPTVGSGAFLFAALNILFPMYEKIINKKFLEFKKLNSKYWRTFFEPEICNIKEHPNVNYFVLKTIIVNNLYGVDIVEEATEICKLRLFLKLAAQIDDVNYIEPLPDIDFNIKAGNTLVGIVDIKDIQEKYNGRLNFNDITNKIYDLDKKLIIFRGNQLLFGPQIIKKENLFDSQKNEIQELLNEINLTVNKDLQDEYGIKDYNNFMENYKPFNWYVEFNEIIKDGGFDVIIGNPPYVEYSKVRNQYQIKGYKTEKCGNLYAFVVERSLNLLKNDGRFGMILPIWGNFNIEYESLRNFMIYNCKKLFLSHFAVRPSKLFEGADMNLTITILLKEWENKDRKLYTTGYYRWYKEERSKLFADLRYIEISNDILANINYMIFPKIGSPIEVSILKKILKINKRIRNFATPVSKNIPVFIHSGGRYWRKAFEQEYIKKIKFKLNSNWKEYKVSEKYCYAISCLLNSSLFYWFWIVFSDCYTVKNQLIDMLPVAFKEENLEKFKHLYWELVDDYTKNISVNEDYKFENKYVFNISKSKHIIDQIDRELAKHYGFTEEELNFIINYDIKFRMGKENNED